MPGSSDTTKTTSTSTNPWAPTIPGLNTAISGALNAFGSTYQGSGVAAKDPLVTQGQNIAIGKANAGGVGNIGTQAIGNVNGTLGTGGLTNPQLSALTGLGSALTNAAGTTDAVKSYLTPYANGSMIGANPYLDALLAQSDQDTADAVNRQFSAAGRYGSGSQAAALGKAIGAVNTQARLGQYNTDVSNMLGANGQLLSAGNAGLSNAVTGLGQIGNLGQQGFANNLTAAGAAGDLNNAQNTDANTLSGIGSQNMAYSQSEIDAKNQNPWTNVGNLASVLSGIGGLGGTANGTSTQSTDTGITGLFGNVLAGAGVFKNLFSDERLKENLQKVGKLDNGLPVYSFNYRGDPRPQIGLVAQDVEKVNPDAVQEVGGYKTVDYGLASLGSKRRAA